MKDNCRELYQQGKFVDAENCFKLFLKEKPDDLGALINLGNCYYRQDKFEDALLSFSDVLKIHNNDDYILNMAGLCCYNLGNLKSSLEYFLRSIQHTPENDNTLYWLGLVNFRLGDYNSALEYFDKAIKIDPQNTSYLGLKGECLLHLEQFTDALEYFDKADSDATDQYYQNLRCIVFFKQNNLSLLEKTMQSLNSDSNENSLFTVFLKNLLEQSKKTLEIYKTIFTLHPEEIFKNEIISDYSKKIITKNQSFDKIQSLKSDVISNFHGNNLSDVISTLQELHLIDDSDSITWYWDGLSHFKLEKFSDSLNCFKKCVKLDSENQYYQFWLGITNYYAKNYGDAKSNFEKCINFKNDPEYFYWKAHSHEKLGEYENATECFKMAITDSTFY